MHPAGRRYGLGKEGTQLRLHGVLLPRQDGRKSYILAEK